MAIRKALERLYFGCGVIAAVCLMGIGVLVLLSVVARPIGLYIPGLNTYAGYLMAASSFMALAYTFRRNGHIRVNLLLSRLRGGRHRALQIWCHGIAALLSIYIAYYLIDMVLVSLDFGDVSEAADATPLWIPQSALAVGAVVFALSIVDSLIARLMGWERDGEEETGAQSDGGLG